MLLLSLALAAVQKFMVTELQWLTLHDTEIVKPVTPIGCTYLVVLSEY